MDFREASDRLFAGISHADLAETLGVSVASIRQARLGRSAKAFREPPRNWRDAAIKLAGERAAYYKRLSDDLRGDRF
jgi:hypothetical protein